MNEGDFSATLSTTIFDDCKIISSSFREITFEHCNREANEMAHELARHSFTEHLDCIWDDDPLAFYFLSS
jgi:hypothetical protein